MPLYPGDPAPWFHARTTQRDRFAFDTVAGRYIVLFFFGSAAAPHIAATLAAFHQARRRFDDEEASLFGVSIDPQDEAIGRVPQDWPGMRVFWDFDASVSTLYEVAQGPGDLSGYQVKTLVLDPNLRVVAVFPLVTPGEEHVAGVLRLLDRLPPVPPEVPAGPGAPVLALPGVFEPELCQMLIDIYDRGQSEESGFVRNDESGKTVLVVDHTFKRRRDVNIDEPRLKQSIQNRFMRRVVPEIEKAYQFKVTRMERYIVACYDAQTGGFFRVHRDNTTAGTAHRRFAVSVHLNSEQYEGGELRFPEFGRQLYKPPSGAAVVFSCGLLHEAMPVRSGRRYVFLPFLYDDAAARIREQNNQYLDASIGQYRK